MTTAIAPGSVVAGSDITLDVLNANQGQDLTMTVRRDDGTEETGTFQVIGALPQGVIIYQKKKGPETVQLEQIVSFEVPKKKAKEPKVKTLKPVTEDNIVQHLLDRHGATLEYVKETPISDQMKWHEDTHAAYNLGHVHKAEDADSTTPAPAATSSQESTQE